MASRAAGEEENIADGAERNPSSTTAYLASLQLLADPVSVAEASSPASAASVLVSSFEVMVLVGVPAPPSNLA